VPRPLPDAKRRAILTDIQSGEKPCRRIAREHGVAQSTVSKIAREEGLSFDRTKTVKATRAKQADNRARRAQIGSDLLDDVGRLRARAWSEYQQPMSTPKGPAVLNLSLPPLTEVRAAYTSIGICLDKNIAVERHDADTGTENARSVLGALGEALLIAADSIDGETGDS
jgi:transposase-like protein